MQYSTGQGKPAACTRPGRDVRDCTQRMTTARVAHAATLRQRKGQSCRRHGLPAYLFAFLAGVGSSPQVAPWLDSLLLPAGRRSEAEAGVRGYFVTRPAASGRRRAFPVYQAFLDDI